MGPSSSTGVTQPLASFQTPHCSNVFRGASSSFNSRRCFPLSGVPTPAVMQNSPISKGMILQLMTITSYLYRQEAHFQISAGSYTWTNGLLKFKPIVGGTVYKFYTLKTNMIHWIKLYELESTRSSTNISICKIPQSPINSTHQLSYYV